ncbi:MAG: helix-turn-helix domain-containing protein [Candidatus Gracilibacteria bacterium]|nr:helix-turn-helix domain-containing protein [Candidatus Gracilibacteria bacterium]
MLINTLKNYGFNEKEAKVYLACLELGNGIVSSIARHAGEHRITTYSILKDLKTRGIANEITKNKVKYFSVISPEQLLAIEEKKVEKLKNIMPELLAVSNAFGNKPKVYFYDGFERVRDLFKEIVDYGDYINEPYLTFVGTQDMDERFENFLKTEFIKYRNTQKNPTKAIITKDKSNYGEYHVDMHNTLVIDDQLFEMGNEIVIYGNRVAVLSYKKDEIYGLIIESNILSKGFKSMFNLIWKAYKK